MIEDKMKCDEIMDKGIKLYTNMLNNIDLVYKEADVQSGLFTNFHTKYECILKKNGKEICFTYQCNKRYNRPNKEDCLVSLFIEDESNSLLKMIMCDSEIEILKKYLSWR